MVATGFLTQGFTDTLAGLWALQIHPARLINDYTRIAGAGATLVNAALVAAVGLVLVRITDIRMSGPALSAVFTMLGFGFFGKTPVNIAPIIFGVYLASYLTHKRFNEYILIALFGTALAPVVSMVAVEIFAPGLLSWSLAVAGGVVMGVLLPPAAMVMLRFHQGYNLYNIGLTSGFLALFAASLVIAGGAELPGTLIWNTEPGPVLVWLIPALSFVFFVAALTKDPLSVIRDFLRINRLSGRLPSDFMDMVSIRGALVNMGVLGMVTWGYVMVVGAPLNGPVLGGILTVIAFGGFGKHPTNCWPVMAGIFAATLAFGVDLTAPGAILAILFGTTLAPLAGDFGIGVGFVAGFLHLIMVSRSGGWHGGISLYNNGFAGGLTATLLAAVMEWHQTTRDTAKKEEA